MYKTLFAIAGIFAATANVQAVELVNQDGTQLTQVCIAAAQNNEAINDVLAANGIKRAEANQILCNGEKLVKFAKSFRTEKTTTFALEAANGERETQLCVAAATSNQAFAETKARLFNNARVFNVECNGMKLAKFAKRHGNKAFNG